MSLVSLVEAGKNCEINRAIANSLELIGFEFSSDIRNVVIKPNMCYYWDYSTGETTDPKFVEAIIKFIRDQTSSKVNISIVESDASAMKCKYAFRFLGYEKIAGKNKVELVNLSKEKSEMAKVTIGDSILYFKHPQIIRDADLRVNVPVIKRHSLTKISCALKNIYGCNPYPMKYKYHKKIDKVIVALNKMMEFDLCIVDALIASGSQPKKLDLVMAGLDQVAIDAVAAKIAGVNPRRVRHITLASEESLGNLSFITKGETLEHFQKKFPREHLKSEMMKVGYRVVNKLGLSNRLGLAQ